jgi:hypothetical protein
MQRRNLILFLSQDEEHRLDELQSSQHQKPPHPIKCFVFAFRCEFVNTFPGVSEAEAEIVEFHDKICASDDLKDVVGLNDSGDV